MSHLGSTLVVQEQTQRQNEKVCQMKPLLSRSGKNQHCHSLPNMRFGIQCTQTKEIVSYLRAKQLSMPDLPKNQQHPMNRIMDKPAVAHSNAWKKLAVRVTEVLSWL